MFQLRVLNWLLSSVTKLPEPQGFLTEVTSPKTRFSPVWFSMWFLRAPSNINGLSYDLQIRVLKISFLQCDQASVSKSSMWRNVFVTKLTNFRAERASLHSVNMHLVCHGSFWHELLSQMLQVRVWNGLVPTVTKLVVPQCSTWQKIMSHRAHKCGVFLCVFFSC